MNSKRKKFFNGYYLIIIILCLLVGLLIWYIFQEALTDLDRQKENSYKKKLTSIVQPVEIPMHQLSFE